MFNRFDRWSKTGKWTRIFHALEVERDDESISAHHRNLPEPPGTGTGTGTCTGEKRYEDTL